VTGCCLCIAETPGSLKGRILLPSERSRSSQEVVPSVKRSRVQYAGMRRIPTFQSTMNLIYDSDTMRLLFGNIIL